MIYSGMLSITFRKLNVQDIVDLTRKAGLQAIEWGGDIHVPPGDVRTAREVKEMTVDAGLQVSSYGSYYKVGVSDDFEKVLESAKELDAPLIRVWAGDRGSHLADEAWWHAVISDAREISAMAARENIGIAFEYHANTLTDQPGQAIRLLTEAGDHNISCYWQPVTAKSVMDNLAALTSLKPWLANLHVFHWSHEPRERLSLGEGESAWRQYIQAAEEMGLPGNVKQRYAMLEFVKDDSPEQFLRDAVVLKQWLAK